MLGVCIPTPTPNTNNFVKGVPMYGVEALVVLNNGDLVSGSSDCTIKIWDVENGTLKKEIKADLDVDSLVVDST